MNAFLTLSFLVGVVSDFTLQWASRRFTSSNMLSSLQVYFAQRSPWLSAIYAGATVLLGVWLTLQANRRLFGFYVPSGHVNLVLTSILGFIIGWVLDVLIKKFKPFGDSLDPYYEVAGAGFWGAAALVFAIMMSFVGSRLIA